MHFVCLISILGLWGCSKEATCPSSARNAFETALKGQKRVNQLDFNVGTNQDEINACVRLFTNDPRAWNYLYGGQGQARMQEFQKWDSRKQNLAAVVAFQYFIQKAASGLQPNDLSDMDAYFQQIANS